MKNNILLLGDIHGSFNNFMWHIKSNKLTDCVIYQVGDFGIGFTNEYNDMATLGNINKFLRERNIQMYVIRGNHDNPYFFDGHLMNHFENLHLIPDYTVIDINGYKILGVGGAVSIDRRGSKRDQLEYAKAGRDIELYWYDEVFVLNEEKIKSIEGVDIVVTHTAPNFCAPVNKNGFGYLVDQFAEDDVNLKKDLIEERDLVTKMWELLKEKNPNIKYHFYGHFHNTHNDIINGVEHRLLGVNEMYDPRLD